jgi:hypothetical protein
MQFLQTLAEITTKTPAPRPRAAPSRGGKCQPDFANLVPAGELPALRSKRPLAAPVLASQLLFK